MTEGERRWQVILPRQVEKTLYRLPKPVLQRIDQVLLTLVENPYPAESHPLAGYYDLYRLPVEEWRITYTVEEERLIVLILELAPKQQPERYRLEEELDESPSSPHVSAPPERADTLPIQMEKFIRKQHYDVFRTELGNLIRQGRQKRIRLLIVDDLAETRENLRKLLSFEPDVRVVGAATNGEEAIQLAIELNPDVILMDILMPGLDGITATEKISQQVPTAQVIMMSVHGEVDYLRRAMLAGAREFLIKPFARDELMASIRRVYQLAAFQKLSLQSAVSPSQDPFRELKTRLQNKLLAELDPKADILDPDEMRPILQEMFERTLAQENIILSRSERERLFENIMTEMLGAGDPSELDQVSPDRLRPVTTNPSQENYWLEGEAEEVDEGQKRALAQWFKFFKLGRHLEISLAVADLPMSLSFYEKLGLEKVDGGEEPFPWAVVSDGRFHLALHQRVFSSPTLSYFALGILSERMAHLTKLGIKLDYPRPFHRLGGLMHGLRGFATAEFESPEGQRVLLADRAGKIEATPTGRKFFSKYGTCGELSLKTEDVKATMAYWEQLGFECLAEGNQPYPWAIVSDGLIRLGFHQTPRLTKPTITYFAPDMPDRLERLHQQGLKFVAEHKDKQGHRVGAMIESPDGQPFLLFSGEFKSPQVDRILNRSHMETSSMKINLEVGQKVRIIEGPFEDFLGIVDEVDPDQAKVKVRVSFFGQEKSVHLDFSQVERI